MGLTCNDLNQSACVSLLNTAEASCVGESCSSPTKDKETAPEEESSEMGDSSAGLDNNTPRDGWMGVDKESGGQLSGGITEEEKGGDAPESQPHIQPGPPQPLEGMDDSGIPYSRRIQR